MKVCVLSLCEVGLPTAKYILSKGYEVYGYDISSTAIKRAEGEGVLEATDIWDEVPSVDVYVVCISTLLKGDVPDLSPVFDVCEKLHNKRRKNRNGKGNIKLANTNRHAETNLKKLYNINFKPICGIKR